MVTRILHQFDRCKMDVLLGLLFLNNDYLVYRKPLTMHERLLVATP